MGGFGTGNPRHGPAPRPAKGRALRHRLGCRLLPPQSGTAAGSSSAAAGAASGSARSQSGALHYPHAASMEAPHAMPLLAFGEERLDPDLALTHRFGIGLRLVVPAPPVQIRLREVAVQLSAVVTGRALCFERAGISGGGGGPVLSLLGLGLPAIRTQELALRAPIDILHGVIGELGGPQIRRHV